MRYSCSFGMSTPTTQAAGTPVAFVAASTVVASSATTRSSSASSPVVTSTVTKSSSPKRYRSLGEYKKARGNTVFARDELQALFDADSDADMDDSEEAEETSSSRRDDPGVRSRRPREDNSDASSSKRSRGDGDRPLADVVPLSSPRSGGDSTPSGVVASRTAPVRDPWMPTPSEIESRFVNTAPPSQYALYSCSGIKDDDATKELDFDPATDQRRDYFIGLFHELRWYGNKKTSRRSRVPEWQPHCQSWGAFVDNFNKDPAGYRERVRSAREHYERFSKRPKIGQLHRGAVEAGIPCAVPMGIACEHCHAGTVRVSEREINGHTDIRVPVELKALHTNLIAQMSSSTAGGHSNLPRAVDDYTLAQVLRHSADLVVVGFVRRHHFRNVTHQDVPRLPRIVVRGQSSPTNTKMIRTLGTDLTIDNSLDDPASCSLCVSQWGCRQREDATGLVRQTPLIALRLLNASRRLSLPRRGRSWPLLKDQIAQVSQTGSNVQVDLGSRLAVLRTRGGALDQASAPSHQQ
ncbi:unnamed protein product [Phytophthora fragariaefolia]|uniref:Unnamed protein product n=1 Tax=Phytophthora fragariaefolia TaxID=1490495 RepID=A0A9W6WZG6_9STRA|nr:unnamed protein product [Phytophthora fragariaefolia]